MEALQELDALANEVGDFICYWGFKKIHGRIWTHLFLSEVPLDAGQLMRRLGVSKALISLSLNDLMRYDVIQVAAPSERNTQTYVANPNVLDVIFNVLRGRESQMLTRTQTGFQLLSSLPSETLEKHGLSADRLDSLGQMIQNAQSALENVLSLSGLGEHAFENFTVAKISPK